MFKQLKILNLRVTNIKEEIIITALNRLYFLVARVAQSIRHPTLGSNQGHDFRVLGSSLASGSALSTESVCLSPSLWAPLPCPCALSLCFSFSNK